MLLNWIAGILILAAGAWLFISRDWRWNLGAAAIQYLAAFWLVQASWPLAASAVKLITGWMACAAMGITLASAKTESGAEHDWREGGLFRLFAVALASLTAFILAGSASAWLGIPLPITWGSLTMMAVGLLLIGMTTRPLRVILGLLTLLAGFEIIYAAIESSALVTAAQALITLGLALVGAYFLVAAREEPPQ
ncbi:MAG: hypothetical protein ABWK53_04550 [Anaerolineales bacterium]